MWIDRHIEPLLLQRAATRPVVVLGDDARAVPLDAPDALRDWI